MQQFFVPVTRFHNVLQRQEHSGVACFFALLLLSLGLAGPNAAAQTAMVQVPFVNTVMGIPSSSASGTPAGTPCTSSTPGYIGSAPTANGCPGTQALVGYPYNVAVDSAGSLAVAQGSNYGIAVLYEGGATMSSLLTHALPGYSFTPTVGHAYILTTAYSSGIPLTLNGGKYYCGNNVNNGVALDSNGDGCAAQYDYVNARQVTIDPDGNIFFSQLNPAPICIRVIYAGGVRAANLINAYNPAVAAAGGPKVGYIYALSSISTTAGTQDFLIPRGIAAVPVSATQENLFVTDNGASTAETGLDAATSGMQIKEFVCPVGTTGCNTAVNGATYGATGWATYIVGGGTAGGVDGDGGLPGAATLVTPQEIMGDKYGDLFFMDAGLARLRVVYNGGTTLPLFDKTTAVTTPVVGNVYTVAGGGSGLVSPAAVNTLSLTPTLFGLDPAGNLYFLSNNMLWVENANSSTGKAVAIGFGGATTSSPYSANASPAAGASCNGSSSPITGPVMTDAYADGCPATQVGLGTPENGIIPFDAQGNFYLTDARTTGTAAGVVRKYSFGNNFGSAAAGASVNASFAFTPSISGGGTTYTPGAPSFTLPDFTDAGNDACRTETGIVSTQTCVYNVTFKPSLAGARKGSMTLTQTTALDTILLSGVGTGAQIASDPALQTVIGSGLAPGGVGIDQSGNLYISSGTSTGVVYQSVSGGVPVSFATGFINPAQVAVDGAGNVYVADSGNNRIATVTSTGGAATAFLGGTFGLTSTSATPNTVTSTSLINPTGVAADQSGNIYIADTGNNRVIEVVTSVARAATQNVLLNFSGLSAPRGLAVDAAGDVFVADSGNARIVELSAAGVQSTVSISPSLSNPVAVAVDAAGDLYIADSGNQNVDLLAPGSATATSLLGNTTGLAGLAIDPAGNLFVASSTATAVTELNRTGISYTYPITAVGSTSSLTPLTLNNTGNSSLTTGSSLSSNTDPTDFSIAAATTNGCTTNAVLTPGQNCSLTATFQPQSAGTFSATVAFFPNSNAVYSASATLGGTGAQGGTTSTTTLSIPTTTVVAGQSVSMTASVTLSAGIAAGSVAFYDGSTLLGSATLSSGSASFSTSSLSVGAHSITAIYPGQTGTSSGSSSSATLVTVTSAATPPSQASAAGYTTMVFDDEFNTLNISPSRKSSSTYNWYPGLLYESTPPPTSEITATSGVLDLDWNKATGVSNGLYDTSIEGESSNGAAGKTFRYGYFEARMKWDNVTGAWPAFWMEPVQGIFKATNTAEIDIFEGQGGTNTYYGTLHTWNGSTQTWYSSPNNFTIPANNDFNAWHIYGILWVPGSGSTPGRITWYFDNQEVGSATTTSSNNSLFDQQDFFLILGSQEGPNWTAGNLTGVTASDINLYVDWVHVWQSVVSMPTVNVMPSFSSIAANQALTVNVDVSGVVGGTAPTGSVTLTSGSYSSAISMLSGGSVTIYIPAGSLPIGADTLTVSYSGDGNYSSTTGVSLVTVTTALNPSFTVSGTAVTIVPGNTTGNTSTITVMPSGGFTGSVILTAIITSSPNGAGDLPTLSFGSTNPVLITGANSGSATLIITTTASSSLLVYPKRHGASWYTVGSAALACALLFGVPSRRRSWQPLLGMLVLLVTFAGGILACGGGGGGSRSSSPGTSPGTYTITVTGSSGSTTATGTVTVTVQ